MATKLPAIPGTEGPETDNSRQKETPGSAKPDTAEAKALRRKGKKKKKDVYDVLKSMVFPNAPKEMRYEWYERPRFIVEFDDIHNTILMREGRDGLNCIHDGWIDAVKNHDEIVLEVEKSMDVYDQVEKEYNIAKRVYDNHFCAWGIMNDEPEDYEKYVKELKPLCLPIESLDHPHNRLDVCIKRHLKTLDDEDRAEMKEKWEHYLEKKYKYEKLIPFEKLTIKYFKEFNIARKELDKMKATLNALKDREQIVATKITEDHIAAANAGKLLGEMFPTIRMGYMISKINGVEMEGRKFKEIEELIGICGKPSMVEFRRYDYMLLLDGGAPTWVSYQELREKGRYAPDPRFERDQFVAACRDNMLEYVEDKIYRGMDIEAIDSTESTGMHLAAAHEHIEMMELLLKKKAKIDARNKNMETPLLVATRKGAWKSVQFLCERGADKHCMDRHRRPPLIYAILNKDAKMVNYFLRQWNIVNCQDYHWGWTPLHFAAYVGSLDICKILIQKKASKYRLSKKKQLTATEVARESKYPEIVDYLIDLVFKDPAQKVLWNDTGLQIWLGCTKAAHPEFATNMGFDAFLLLFDHGLQDNETLWINRDEDLMKLAFTFKVIDDDKTEQSWKEIALRLTKMVAYIEDCCAKERKLLIACDKGVSTSIAVLLAFLVLKRNIRYEVALEHFKKIRREVAPSSSMLRGITKLEYNLDQSKLKRLAERLHYSELMDLAHI